MAWRSTRRPGGMQHDCQILPLLLPTRLYNALVSPPFLRRLKMLAGISLAISLLSPCSTQLFFLLPSQMQFMRASRVSACSGGEQVVFLSEVLADISLTEADDAGRIESLGLGRAPCSNTKALQVGKSAKVLPCSTKRQAASSSIKQRVSVGNVPAACRSCSEPPHPSARGTPRSSVLRGP